MDTLVEKDTEDLPELVGRLLVREVERRMRRNLTRGYMRREDVLTRVRGRIDVLATASRRLMDGGEVACRFDELTLDTPRNRLVRAALGRLSRLIVTAEVAGRARRLAADFGRAGVSGVSIERFDPDREQIGRNDAADRFMLALARLAFDLSLPTEEAGATAISRPERDEQWVRRLFENAVAGFYGVELRPHGWRVRSGVRLDWQRGASSSGIDAILPTMRTDIILDTPNGRRIVIDTKFAAIVEKGWYREESLKASYLYQMYAYLRSQELPADPDCSWTEATGIVLHPAINKAVDETVTIQGHEFRFVTVDLAEPAQMIRARLREIVYGTSGEPPTLAAALVASGDSGQTTDVASTGGRP